MENIIFNKDIENLHHNMWLNKFKQCHLPLPYKLPICETEWQKSYILTMKASHLTTKILSEIKEKPKKWNNEFMLVFEQIVNHINDDILEKEINTEADFDYLEDIHLDIVWHLFPLTVHDELKKSMTTLYANFGILSHSITINIETGNVNYNISNMYNTLIEGYIPSIESNFNMDVNKLNTYITELLYEYNNKKYQIIDSYCSVYL